MGCVWRVGDAVRGLSHQPCVLMGCFVGRCWAQLPLGHTDSVHLGAVSSEQLEILRANIA
jgi:hypothetical protein